MLMSYWELYNYMGELISQGRRPLGEKFVIRIQVYFW